MNKKIKSEIDETVGQAKREKNKERKIGLEGEKEGESVGK